MRKLRPVLWSDIIIVAKWGGKTYQSNFVLLTATKKQLIFYADSYLSFTDGTYNYVPMIPFFLSVLAGDIVIFSLHSVLS